MLKRVEKMLVFPPKKKEKEKILWAFIDEDGHTIIQVYSDKYPSKTEKWLKKQEND